MTLIQWTTNPSSTNTTTTVPVDGLLRGIGSKQITLNYTGSGSAITVDANARLIYNPNNGTYIDKQWQKTATIENLIIDGTGSSNATAIYLEDVYNCAIRNITIKNFSVGIKITATDDYGILGDGHSSFNDPAYRNFSEANTIKHVRLENVKTGILFDNGTGDGSFPFTNIDDVGIQLVNDNTAVGIQVGNSTDPTTKAHPYSSLIRAHIWMQSQGGTGLKLVQGEIKYGLVNLTVNGPSTGIGADLRGNASDCIIGNKPSGLYLTCAGIASATRVLPTDGSINLSNIQYSQSY